jgi:hypothetical protein
VLEAAGFQRCQRGLGFLFPDAEELLVRHAIRLVELGAKEHFHGGSFSGVQVGILDPSAELRVSNGSEERLRSPAGNC